MKRFNLPPLPYSYDALEPVISKRIMELHHDKHHAAYVKGANAALEKLDKYAKGELEIDVRAVMRDLSFHLNGHILHTLFWPNLAPPSDDNKPGGRIGDLIDKQFGSFENFKKVFTTASNTLEGVGWAILYVDPEDNLYILQVEKHNLNHPASLVPILVSDLWEHSYYLQYENRRAEYVENFWKVINWDEVEKRLEKKEPVNPP